MEYIEKAIALETVLEYLSILKNYISHHTVKSTELLSAYDRSGQD